MVKSNLHTHTKYSDGENTAEENVLEAIEKGFVSLGFSDHSYTEFDLTYCMKAQNEDDYRNEIISLRDKYRGEIEVYCGIELDGYSERPENNKYDYIIGSCHYLNLDGKYYSVDHCIEGHKMILEEFFGNDTQEFAKKYFATMTECTRLHKPDIIGHFDLVSKFGFMKEDSAEYRDALLESLVSCLEVTPIIELNNGSLSRGIRTVPYPAPYVLPEIKSHGGKILISSDSHKKCNLDYAFEDMVELIKKYGINSIVVLKNGQFSEIGI